MVARLEGPSSPVNTILAGTGRNAAIVYDDNGEVIVSLADRIRTLQKAASDMGSDDGEPAKP
jgi:hypothetical protein